METQMPTEELVLGPTIGFRRLMKEVGRKWRFWVVTGLVGLSVGASLHFVIPRKYTAVTDLYVVTPANSDTTQAMANNVSLLQTRAVAQEAVASGHLPMTADEVLSKYTGIPLSGNIMSIKFSGTSQSEAVLGAKSVAQAFLVVQAREVRLQTSALVRGLSSQISSLNSQISSLNTQINFLSRESPNAQTSNQVINLVNQRAGDASQASQLQDQIQQALLVEQSTDIVNHVLDPATLEPVSTTKVVVVDALSGLVAGLALGLVAVTFGALLSSRPPNRSAVVAALGAPVELSLGRLRSPRVMRRRRLSRQLRKPTPELRMIERRLLGHLESAPGSALGVVAIGASEQAAVAVYRLARALSSKGHHVVVVDAARDRPLASILGLTANFEAMETVQLPVAQGPSVRVMVAPKDPLRMAQKPPPDDADALLVLATLDAAFGAEHLTPWVTDVVMILSLRQLAPTQIDVSAEMLRDAGISLHSVILLDTDPEDESSGVLRPVDSRLTLTSVESAGSSD